MSTIASHWPLNISETVSDSGAGAIGHGWARPLHSETVEGHGGAQKAKKHARF